MSKAAMWMGVLGALALWQTVGCTPGECLRHSDCPREWRCRRSLCRFVGNFAASDASVPDVPSAGTGGAAGTASTPVSNGGRGGMGGMAGQSNAGQGTSEDLDASVMNNVGTSTNVELDASIPP